MLLPLCVPLTQFAVALRHWEGGSTTEAKLTAARDAGIRVILIARPPKPQVPAVAEVDDLVAAVEGVLSP